MIDYSYHKNILIQILKSIYTDTKIATKLGFKGGTASFLFYGLNRFSVDLDFDLLDLNEKKLVYETLEKILKKHGLIKEQRLKRYTIFFLLTYNDKAPNIKIEINLRQFGSQYLKKNYLGIPIKVMEKNDVFANKLVAMYEREGNANRDIFDIHYFLKKQWSINLDIIKIRTGLNKKDFIIKCIEILEKKSNNRILSGLADLLDKDQKQWVKNELINETIFLLKLYQ